MPLDARHLHSRLYHVVLATGVLLGIAGLAIVAVGIPAVASQETSLAGTLAVSSLPLGILASLFAATEVWAVHRGELRLAWFPATALAAFAVGVYQSAGHLVAPLVAVNVLGLAALHGLDRWLVRA